MTSPRSAGSRRRTPQDARRLPRSPASPIEQFLETGDRTRLVRFLERNSRLPGPRANLELAGAFADIAGGLRGPRLALLWDLAVDLAGISAAHVPANSPRVFPPFCATLALGAIGSAAPAHFRPALGRLRLLARDPRWRIREAAAMALQRLIAARRDPTLRALARWVAAGDWLAMRAVATAVAEPALLADAATARVALRLHRRIVDKVLRAQDRGSEGFRVLRQALGYSISVVAVARPKEGLSLLRGLISSGDPDARWIARENLKKHRLIRAFPGEATALRART